MTTEQNGSGTAVSIRTMVLDHEERIDALESWRDKALGMATLVKFIAGASIVTTILQVASFLGWKPPA